MRRPITIKQLQKASKMSARRNLRIKGSNANPHETIIDIAKSIIAKAEKRRSGMAKDIVHGSKIHTKLRR